MGRKGKFSLVNAFWMRRITFASRLYQMFATFPGLQLFVGRGQIEQGVKTKKGMIFLDHAFFVGLSYD